MNRSFTIIELVFVIVIIGVLAAIALPKLSGVQDDALASIEKSAVGATRQSIISFHGWALIHSDSNTTVEIADKDNNLYKCAIYFSKYRYPVTLTSKQTGVATDNNYSVGSSTNIGDYKTLAPMMLDPATIKDWNSTRVDLRFEHLCGPASNFVEDKLAEIHKGMYWLYDNKNGHIMLKE